MTDTEQAIANLRQLIAPYFYVRKQVANCILLQQKLPGESAQIHIGELPNRRKFIARINMQRIYYDEDYSVEYAINGVTLTAPCGEKICVDLQSILG